jgi:hypothetical protein
MELLRIAENVVEGTNLVRVSFDVSGDYDESEFILKVTDLADLSFVEETYTSSDGETINVEFSSKYDNSYRVQFYSVDDNFDLYDETFFIVRPYVNPNSLGVTASEIDSAKNNEEIARAIIDSVIPQGFYYKKITMETVGLGADYLPLWMDAKKVLKVFENNVLIYDSENKEDYALGFEITRDKTAITYSKDEQINRYESARNILPAGGTDYLDLNFSSMGGFPRGYDYRIIMEAGHTKVPSDIERATKLLIEDLSCGKLDYYKRYISAYNTDQYKIQFDKSIFEGTGNILVDKILSKYAKSITRLEVL